jgi:5-formyltetrahydrofolate cyclo-ligase
MISDDKAVARARARALRRDIPETDRIGAGARAAALFLGAIPLSPASVISAYWPLDDEFDCRPLLEALLKNGHAIAMPVVAGPKQPLVFRHWKPGDAMAESSFGIMEPLAEAGVVQPDAIITPLVAYNAQGFRLGYGGGYYDRTLRALRQTAPDLLAIGLAFASQVMAELPVDGGDEPLDWLVHERGVQKFQRS